MEKTQVLEFIKNAMTGNASVNFADREEAAKSAILEYYGLPADATGRALKKVDFDLVDEALDEVIPAQIENIMGGFCTTLTFKRNEEVKYTIKGLGKRRQLLTVLPGARAGVYKARRWDKKVLPISTKVVTAGAFVNLEEFLSGEVSLQELFQNVLDGVMLQVYKEIVDAMRTIKTLAPAKNIESGANVDADKIDGLVRIASAYGTPVIVCFESMAKKFNNLVGFTGATPNFPASDVEEIKNKGAISLYKGTQIIQLPNYLVDETNSSWVFSEADAFILPTAEKPVVLAFQGEGYTQINEHALGGAQYDYHRIMGTAVLTYNDVCIYTDTAIAALQSGTEI